MKCRQFLFSPRGSHGFVVASGKLDLSSGDEEHVYGTPFALDAASTVSAVTGDDRSLELELRTERVRLAGELAIIHDRWVQPPRSSISETIVTLRRARGFSTR